MLQIPRVPPNINKNVLIFDTIKLNKCCSEGEAVMWLVKSRGRGGGITWLLTWLPALLIAFYRWNTISRHRVVCLLWHWFCSYSVQFGFQTYILCVQTRVSLQPLCVKPVLNKSLSLDMRIIFICSKNLYTKLKYQWENFTRHNKQRNI